MPATTAAVTGKIAIIDRGACGFAVKAKNAQNAGAFGVIIANNAAGAAPGLGGSRPDDHDPDGQRLAGRRREAEAAVADAVKYGTRGKAGLGDGRARASTRRARPVPTPTAGRCCTRRTRWSSGSSVSHWDVSAFPNLLMEPNINADLTTTLVPPLDLTLPLLKDLGW